MDFIYYMSIRHRRYQGNDVCHDLDNSTEGTKIKQSCDEYNGARPSDEGSSNDVSHSKKIPR